MKKTEQKDIELLKKTVDHFSQAMKIKLIECAKRGKTGWDGKYSESELIERIIEDANGIHNVPLSENKKDRAVDIANRSMMIWYLHYGKALMQAD